MANVGLSLTGAEISLIDFGILPRKDVETLAICDVTTTGKGRDGTVNDPRLGPVIAGETCPTCDHGKDRCVGHFGRIGLKRPLIMPLFRDHLAQLISCFCFNCKHLIFSEETLSRDGYLRMSAKERFEAILKRVKGSNTACWKCLTPPMIINKNETDLTHLEYSFAKGGKFYIFSAEDIERFLSAIPADQVKLLGIDQHRYVPKDIIIHELPVLPSCARPHVVTSTQIKQDDLTGVYEEIVKINRKMPGPGRKSYEKLGFCVQALVDNSKTKSTRRGKFKGRKGTADAKSLAERLSGKDGQFRRNVMGSRVNYSGRTVASPDPCLKINEIGVPRAMTGYRGLTTPVIATAQNIDQLKRLITAGGADQIWRPRENEPDGYDRIHLEYAMYRRRPVPQPGDTLIRNGRRVLVRAPLQCREGDILERKRLFSVERGETPECKIGDRLHYIGAPEKGIWTTKNVDHPVILDRPEPHKRGGIVIERTEQHVIGPLQPKGFCLKIGDIVERHLVDGDIVMINRQPTLHRGSMQGHYVKLHNAKTLTMSLAVTKAYNADFDGDEINIHVPQSAEAIADLRLLSDVRLNPISPRDSKAMVVIVQDALLGLYLMTRREASPLTQKEWNHIASQVFDLDEIASGVKRVAREGLDILAPRHLVSLALPNDLFYSQNGIVIKRGVLLDGTIKKKVPSVMLACIAKNYGPDGAFHFVNAMQQLARHYLELVNFSVSIRDCGIGSLPEVQKTVARCFLRAWGYYASETDDYRARERAINFEMNKAKDYGHRIAETTSSYDNNFCAMIEAGSKGNQINLAQIQAHIGQQNVAGGRAPLVLSRGRRSLVGYDADLFESPSAGRMDELCEARGFIQNSYTTGLNATEFFIHAMSGREGLTDTAIKTAETGYMQRRLIKFLEDICVAYDGTVRNSVGTILQFVYGEDGTDPSQLVWIDGATHPVDWPTMIAWARGQGGDARILTSQEISEVLQPLDECLPNYDTKHIRQALSVSPIDPGLLATLRHKVEQQSARAAVAPGESVGIHCASSMGHPITQLTLNSFHFAGVSAKNVTLGMKRLQEILSVSKNPKVTSIAARLRKPFRNLSLLNLRRIVEPLFVEKTLGYFLDAPVEPRAFDELEEWEIWHAAFVDPPAEDITRQWMVELFLSPLKMFRYGLTVDAVYKCLQKLHNVYVVPSPNALHRLRLYPQYLDMNEAGDFVRHVLEPFLHDLQVCGMNGIRKIYYTENEKETWIDIEGDRPVFADVLAAPCIDAERTTSDNLYDVANVLGIEAARTTLVNLLEQIISFDGTAVSRRHHLHLLADRMCYRGYLQSVSRYSFDHEETGVIAPASFEQILDNLTRAAKYTETDNTQGVSGSIFCGKRIQQGTGLPQLVMKIPDTI